MTTYEELFQELRKSTTHNIKAKELIPKMCDALREADPTLSDEKIKEKVKNDCDGIGLDPKWIITCLPDELKEKKKQHKKEADKQSQTNEKSEKIAVAQTVGGGSENITPNNVGLLPNQNLKYDDKQNTEKPKKSLEEQTFKSPQKNDVQKVQSQIENLKTIIEDQQKQLTTKREREETIFQQEKGLLTEEIKRLNIIIEEQKKQPVKTQISEIIEIELDENETKVLRKKLVLANISNGYILTYDTKRAKIIKMEEGRK